MDFVNSGRTVARLAVRYEYGAAPARNWIANRAFGYLAGLVASVIGAASPSSCVVAPCRETALLSRGIVVFATSTAHAWTERAQVACQG